MANHERAWWKYGRAMAVPLLLWGLVIASLWEPVRVWLSAGRGFDKASLREWIGGPATDRFQIDRSSVQYQWIMKFVDLLLEDPFGRPTR